MIKTVNLNARDKVDFIANARAAWGEALPAWVLVLAEEANCSSASAVAKRMDYSVAVVSQVIRCSYAGDLGKVEAKVRGVYMGELVDCPILDDIPRNRCIAEQDKRHIGTSAMRTQLFHACRGGCPHSRLKSREACDA